MRLMNHQIFSFIKSGFRIIGLLMIVSNLILEGLILLILAEVLGILEEIKC
mgnify:CR=1 FL=1